MIVGEHSGGTYGKYYIALSVGRLRFTTVTTVGRVDLTAANAVALGWHSIVATYDGAQMRLYHNGVEIASVAQTGELSGDAAPFQIGKFNGIGWYFDGLVDDFLSVPRVLSQSEIIVLSQSRNIFNAEAAELANILNFRLPRSSDNIVGCL